MTWMTVGSDDLPTLKRLQDAMAGTSVNADTRLHVLAGRPVMAANLGLADDVQYMIPGVQDHQGGCSWASANRAWGCCGIG